MFLLFLYETGWHSKWRQAVLWLEWIQQISPMGSHKSTFEMWWNLWKNGHHAFRKVNSNVGCCWSGILSVQMIISPIMGGWRHDNIWYWSWVCCTCNFYFCNKNSCIFQQEEGGDIFHSLIELLGPFNDNPCSQVLLPFGSALIKLGEVSYPFTSGGCLLRLPTDWLAESQISGIISKPSILFH